MSTTLTPEDRLRRADREVEALKESFINAIEELSRSDEVDVVFDKRLGEIDDRFKAVREELEPSAFEAEQLHEIHTALHDIRDLMQDLEREDERLDTLDSLLIRIERVRHILRDALDEHVSGIGNDASRVISQIQEWLPSVPQREIARLVAVDRRTLSRWALDAGAPRRRLRLVAQIVAILRHSWTEQGVVAWFDRPNHDLGNRRPLSILDDADYERDVLMAARATRGHYGT